jgi:hypothetical protein
MDHGTMLNFYPIRDDVQYLHVDIAVGTSHVIITYSGAEEMRNYMNKLKEFQKTGQYSDISILNDQII